MSAVVQAGRSPATPPTPLVCETGALIWFDTSEVKACFTCAAFVECVAKWAADAKIPPPKWADLWYNKGVARTSHRAATR